MLHELVDCYLFMVMIVYVPFVVIFYWRARGSSALVVCCDLVCVCISVLCILHDDIFCCCAVVQYCYF